MASKTLQRSMDELRKRGYVVGKTEMPWNKFSKVRQDFCGFADAIAFHPEHNETLAIQACTDDGGIAKHVAKLIALPNVEKWLSQPSRRLEIWGWGKRGDRGKRKLWTLREVPIVHHKSLDHSACKNICIHDVHVAHVVGTPAGFGVLQPVA